MTSAPITTGVGNLFVANVSGVGQNAMNTDSAFSDVLKNQTDASRPRTAQESSSGPKSTETGKKSEEIRSGSRKETLNRDGSDRSVKKTEAVGEDAQTVPEEAAQELAAEVTAAMLEKTAEVMEVPVEEVEAALEELSLDAADLLNPDGIKQVVLQLAGEEDAAGLVTDEELFGNFKELTQTLQEAVDMVSETTGLSAEEVKELFENPENLTVQENPVPAYAEEAKAVQDVPSQREEKPVLATESAFTDRTQEESEAVTAAPVQDSAQTHKKETHSDGEENQGQLAQHSFTDRLSQQQEQAQGAEAVRETPNFYDSNTQSILNQITDYMRGQVRDGMSELEMQLHPESLGSLHIRLVAKEGLLTAQFTAQNESVKAALESQMIQLQENFKEQGMTVAAIEVTVASHRFDENLQQNTGNQEEGGRQPGARRRQRRLNLDALEEEGLLDEEERLAAEMMAANGGTVDYTV